VGKYTLDPFSSNSLLLHPISLLSFSFSSAPPMLGLLPSLQALVSYYCGKPLRGNSLQKKSQPSLSENM